MPGEALGPLTIRSSLRGRTAVVELIGSADMDQGEALRGQLREAAEAGNPNVVLDLRGLTFICSTWLSVLIQVHKACHARGGQVRLAGPIPPVKRVLETTRLTSIMPVFATVEQAIQGQ